MKIELYRSNLDLDPHWLSLVAVVCHSAELPFRLAMGFGVGQLQCCIKCQTECLIGIRTTLIRSL